MIDTPNPDSTQSETSDNLKNGITSPESSNAPEAAKERPQSEQQPNYSQYVVRPLKAFSRGTVKTVNWLDDKAGFVTAVATVLIAILTGFYVHYSRAQWETMSGQLTQMQTANDTQGRQFAQTLCQMQAQTAAQRQAAGAASTQAAASSTQAEASLRIAKAQEKANAVVTQQFRISQAAQMTMTTAQLAAGKLSFIFTNVGNTDAINFVVQPNGAWIVTREIMDSMHYDPVKELEAFRADPERKQRESRKRIQEMIDRLKTVKRFSIDNPTAIPAMEKSQKELDVQLARNRIFQRIPKATGVEEGGFNIENSGVTVILLLTDWDDIFGTHHSSDFCYTIENNKIILCVSPVEGNK